MVYLLFRTYIMKNKIIITILLFISILSASCFEIIEELQLKENGTGTYALIINMSESKSKLATIMMLDSVQGYKVPKKTEISQQVQKIKQHLSQIPGLSSIQTHFDFDAYTGHIKFQFTNLQQVGNAMKIIMDTYQIKDYSIPTYYYNNTEKQVVRNFQMQPNTIKKYKNLKQEDQEIFNKAKFTSIFKFDRSIQSVSNTHAKVSSSKKAVMQQVTLNRLFVNDPIINNRIYLVK